MAPRSTNAGACRLAPEQHVLGDRQVGRERKLLIDDRDAVLPGRERTGDGDGLPVDQDLAARIRLVGAGQDLHQRRFAGAVLAHERMDFAGMDLERDVRERPHAGERLGDVAHLEDRSGGVQGRPIMEIRGDFANKQGSSHVDWVGGCRADASKRRSPADAPCG